MSTLICNAAEGVLQIVLVRDGAVSCGQEWPAPTRSTEILAPALAHMLQELGMKTQEITRIACVYGPGSFTGIRLVLSTAAALRRALHAAVAPVDYMEALAVSAQLALHDLPCPAGSMPARSETTSAESARVDSTSTPAGGAQAKAATRTLWVLTHARRNLVHCQPFALFTQPVSVLEHSVAGINGGHNGGSAPFATSPFFASLSESAPQALAAVDLCSLDVCAERINSLSVAPLCVGSGVLRNTAFFQQHCPQAHYGGPSYASVRLAALVHLAAHAHYDHADLTPLYIRPCDAVENLPAMAVKLGHDAATAEHRLTTLLQRPTSPDQTYRPTES